MHGRAGLAPSERSRIGAQRVLDRPEHQRERRAELVADVAEEGGLRAIELGERLGAPALFLVGLRVGDARADLARDEVEEPRYSSSKRRNGLSPTTRTPGAAGLARKARWGPRRHARAAPARHPAAARRSAPRARRRSASRAHSQPRPGARPGRAREAPRRGAARWPRSIAGRAGEHRPPLVGVEQVDERERQIVRIRRRASSPPGCTASSMRARVGGAGRELAEQRELPLADDAPGVLGVRADDAAGAAVGRSGPGCRRTCSRSPRGSRCAP